MSSLWELAPAEIRLLEELLKGRSNPEIAVEFKTKERCIKMRLSRIYMKVSTVCPVLSDPGSGERRVKLALFVHEHRHLLGVRCPCDLKVT